MSVLEAAQHPYLLYGRKKDRRGDQKRTLDLPLILDPPNLHFSPPPVRLPARNNNDDTYSDVNNEIEEDDDDEDVAGGEGGGGGGGEGGGGGGSTGEHLWARRQFSVLWAPMPSSYQKSKKVTYIPLH